MLNLHKIQIDLIRLHLDTFFDANLLKAQSISNLSLAAALAITVATIVAAWAFKEHIGQTEVQVMDVSVACVPMNSTLYIREVEVRLIYDLVLGRVWSQTITPETSRRKKQHEVIQQCIGAPLSATHTHWHVLSAILWRCPRPTRVDGLQDGGRHQQAHWGAFVLIHIMEITALNTGDHSRQWGHSSASTTNIQYI